MILYFVLILDLGVIVEPIANQNIRNVFYEGKAAAADYVRGCAGRFTSDNFANSG
jgi:hypothetical protein